MKLNLGSGQNKLSGYENIDIKDGQLAYPLTVADNSCEEIRASHLLEHYGSAEVYNVLLHWVSKLSVGGVLKIAVPDFGKIAGAYANYEKMNFSGYILGGQTDKDDYHKSLFDLNSLTELMKAVGLSDITVWQSEIQDCAALPISLNLQGKKAGAKVRRKVVAVMSMPRLSFTDHVNCLMTEIVARGINVKMGTGVFWSQILTRGIEEVLKNDKPDYILTIDYDTWFRFGHIERLLSLMETNPDADAICPVQMKRECDSPLMGLVGANGERLDTISYGELEKELMPIATGHFGLTVFRPRAFEKMKLPWFKGEPGPDGKWNDGRIDDDIYFWVNFNKSGNKAYIANKVNVGHLQLMCTFPGHYRNNFKPINMPLGDLGKVISIPDHCRA